MALFKSELLFSPGRTRGPTSIDGVVIATLAYVFHTPDVSVYATVATIAIIFHSPDASIDDNFQLSYATPLYGPESVTNHVSLGIAWLTPESVSDDFSLAYTWETPDPSVNDGVTLSYTIT